MRRVAIIPVYREVGKIGRVIERFAPDSVDEIYLIVDNPNAAILAEIESSRKQTTVPIRIIENPVRKGIGYAIKQGYTSALSEGVDIIVVMAGKAQRIRAGILPSLQGPNSRLQVHRTSCVEDVFPNSEKGIFAHISFEGLASHSDANSPSETRGKALVMIQISRTRPVVLKSDSDTESNILREYADFWKIPYELNSSTKGAAIFATGNATASDASRDSPLVISPNGMKEAGRIARSYGLGI